MPGRLVAGGVAAGLVASLGLVVALYAAGSEPRNAGGVGGALGVPEVKSLLIAGILVLALAVGIRRVQTSSAAGLGVLVAIAALVPTAVTTYPRNESYVVLAGAALVIHVIAATTWVGGL